MFQRLLSFNLGKEYYDEVFLELFLLNVNEICVFTPKIFLISTAIDYIFFSRTVLNYAKNTNKQKMCNRIK